MSWAKHVLESIPTEYLSRHDGVSFFLGAWKIVVEETPGSVIFLGFCSRGMVSGMCYTDTVWLTLCLHVVVVGYYSYLDGIYCELY